MEPDGLSLHLGKTRSVFLNAASQAAALPEEFQEYLLSLPLFWALPVLIGLLITPSRRSGQSESESAPASDTGGGQGVESISRLCTFTGVVSAFFAAIACLGLGLAASNSLPVFLILALPLVIHFFLSILLSGTRRRSSAFLRQQLIMAGEEASGKCSPLHTISVTLFCAASASLCAAAAYRFSTRGSDQEGPFLAVQAAYWLVMAFCFDWPRRSKTFFHSFFMREWMLVAFTVTTLIAGSGLIARDAGQPMTLPMVVALATWPLTIALLDGTLRGRVSMESPAILEAKIKAVASQESLPSHSQPLLHLTPSSQAVAETRNTEFSQAATTAAEISELAPLPEVVGVHRESLWNQALFLWMNPILNRGAVKHLTLKDCPKLAEEEHGSTSYGRFLAEMKKQQKRCRKLEKAKSRGTGRWGSFFSRGGEHTQPLLEQNGQNGEVQSEPSGKTEDTPQTKVTSLTCLIGMTFCWEIVSMGGLALLKTVLEFCGPLMLNALVLFTEAPDHSVALGVGLACLMFAMKVGEFLCDTHWRFEIQLTAMKIRSALTGALFHKAMRLSNKAKSSRAGKMTNYLAEDVERIGSFMWWVHDVWVLPLQLIFALAILANMVGWGALGGLGAMILTVIIQLPIAYAQQTYRTEMMKAKDSRMKATSEVIKAMRAIKFWSWETHFQSQVQSLRNTEYIWVRANCYIFCLNVLLLWLCPALVAVSTLGVCVLMGQQLTSAQVFTAIVTFRIIQTPIFFVPQLISEMTTAAVSVKRLRDLLNDEELQDDAVEHERRGSSTNDSAGVVVKVEDGDFFWPEAEKPADEEEENKREKKKRSSNQQRIETTNKVSSPWTLSGISFSVTQGQKVAVCGKVGSGKTSLLSCLLGEMHKTRGHVSIVGSTAYVAQSAWIQAGTIEDCILFGQPYDEHRYESVLQACCLGPDLAQFPKGDKTEIGERGITLSGGQKQRIQLARAVYSDADVYILDDPFSAVDAHTGTHLFKECVLGLLASKTVILVTHQLEFLPAVDLILVLKDGKVLESGTYDELERISLSSGKSEGNLAELLDAHKGALNLVSQEQKSALQENRRVSSSRGIFDLGSSSTTVTPSNSVDQLAVLAETEPEVEVTKEAEERKGKESASEAEDPDEEEREKGSVSFAVYWAYITKVHRGALIPVIVLAQILFQGTQIGSNFWLSYATTDENNVPPALMIERYAALCLGGMTFVVVRAIVLVYFGLSAAQAFFKSMLACMLRARMEFFDRTPSGRILARFSSDQGALDQDLPFSMSGTLTTMTSVVGIMFVTSYITPEVLLVGVPLGIVFAHIQRFYLQSSRELTRVSSVNKAPILNSFSESVAGSCTIRAFGKEQQSLTAALDRVDAYNRPVVYTFGAMEWFMFRLQSLSAVVLFVCAFLMVLLPSDVITPSMVGLSLSYALVLSENLSILAWCTSTVENKIVSVERFQQYSSLPSEAPLFIESAKPAPTWPADGAVSIDNLKVKYREDGPLILKGVSFSIDGGQKVGIVGRTGSGKSTLVSCLFRLIEPVEGRIIIDNIDIGTLGLHDLRTKLGIIPQDPTLFEGTVRSNIDPMGEYSDDRIWEALDTCQLKETVTASQGGLDSSVSEGGENWSVGQRQLLCLGRAVLKRSRILVLDEATASVDSVSDAIIQKTIRENFGNSTVISIAHRIPTVMDSDQVVVMEQGLVKEFASPRELVRNSSSLFSKLVDEYAKRSSSMADLASLIKVQSRNQLNSTTE